MGWLDLIFGKGTTRKVATATKAVGALSGSAKKPEKTANVARPEKKPKLSWSKSDKGNDTTIYDGFRITLFKQGEWWSYCVVEILDEEDLADGMEEDPTFGANYPTKAEAKREALEEVGYY